MILEEISSGRRNFFWSLFHIGLGFACTLTPIALIVWFYLILLLNFGKSISKLQEKSPFYFILLASYLLSFEVLGRMAKTSPFLPYEIGKYLLLLFGLLGVLISGVNNNKGIWMAILMIPAAFIDLSNKTDFKYLIFYLIAPAAIGLIYAFSYQLEVTKTYFDQLLKLIWLGCLTSLVFTIIETPDLDEVTFDLGANFETTGGHASNQVSTLLGLGMFLSFYSVYKKLQFSGHRILDILILGGFTFQGLLSFSRGGMMVGALGILLLIFIPEQKERQKKSNNSIVIAFISIFVLYGVFEITNQLTGGNLLLRYQGQTEGTLAGSAEYNADKITSGRIDILTKDLELWLSDPFTTIFGVGVGASSFLRDDNEETVASHVELSRFLAEHGLLGMIYSLFFYAIPFSVWKVNKKSDYRVILTVLTIIAVATTFHAAIRTFVTPLLIILGILKIKSND
jgi:hypothetical protein